MAHEARYINRRDLREVPAWEHLIDEVRTTKQPAILRADGEDVVEIRVATPTARQTPRTRRGLQPGDALERLIGLAALDTTDLAEQHDTYLAEAHADSHA